MQYLRRRQISSFLRETVVDIRNRFKLIEDSLPSFINGQEDVFDATYRLVREAETLERLLGVGAGPTERELLEDLVWKHTEAHNRLEAGPYPALKDRYVRYTINNQPCMVALGALTDEDLLNLLPTGLTSPFPEDLAERREMVKSLCSRGVDSE